MTPVSSMPIYAALRLADSEPSAQPVTIEDIIAAVCSYYKLTRKQVLGRRAVNNSIYARQVCMVLAKRRLDMSLREIGEHFGDRHHSTVINAIMIVQNACDTKSVRGSEYKFIERRLFGIIK